MPDRIPARRHPHQVFIGALCIVAGVPPLVGGPRSGSLAATLPGWLLLVWSAVLVAGGTLVVVAALVRGTLHGMYLEACAHLPLALMTVAYGAALIIVTGHRGITSAAIVLGFGVAEAARFRQVYRTLRHIHGVLEQAGSDA